MQSRLFKSVLLIICTQSLRSHSNRMSLYSRAGGDDLDEVDDMYFIGDRDEKKLDGFEEKVDFSNKFSFMPAMDHYKAVAKKLAVGINHAYAFSENGELLTWPVELDKNDKGFSVDLRSLSAEGKDSNIMGKAGTRE